MPPGELNQVIVAIVRVFMTNGNRTDRKRARLKHLLESWTLDRYLAETERLLGRQLRKVPLDTQPVIPRPSLPHSHLGVYPQRQHGLNYVGVALPVGQITTQTNAAACGAGRPVRLR